MRESSFIDLLLELPAFKEEGEEEEEEEVPSCQQEALAQELVVQLLLSLPAFQEE